MPILSPEEITSRRTQGSGRKIIVFLIIFAGSIVFITLFGDKFLNSVLISSSYTLHKHSYKSNSVLLIQEMQSMSSWNNWSVFVSIESKRFWLFGPTSRDSFDRIREVYWSSDYQAVCVEYGAEKANKVGFDFQTKREVRDTGEVDRMIKGHQGAGAHIYYNSHYVSQERGPEQGAVGGGDISEADAKSWLRLVPKSP